jgi:hypothetical protein
LHDLVIAGLDPAIHLLEELMDARVKPAHDASLGVVISSPEEQAQPAFRRMRPLVSRARCSV